MSDRLVTLRTVAPGYDGYRDALWLVSTAVDGPPPRQLDHGLDVGNMTYGQAQTRGRSLDDRARPPPRQITPVAPGSYDSAAIILLSDGRRTTGIDTLEAARMAADRINCFITGWSALPPK